MSHLPYKPISQLYQSRFGEKVYKIPVSVADSCPNRQGLKGMQICIFCDEWGSAANKENVQLDLKNQIDKMRTYMSKQYKAHKYLVYFQSYTNTFQRLPIIKEHYETALSYPDVVGLVIGTRPDCLSKSVLDLWNDLTERTSVFVEFGLQSIFDNQLEFLKRGHSAQQSFDAIYRVKKEAPQVEIGIHLMFGLPNETDEDIITTAKTVSELPISDVKLHNLHVLTNTPLADLYKSGDFIPITFESYAQRVMLFLQHLRPNIAVHRLGAVASRWDELVAPEWARYKMEIFQNIVDLMKARGAFQGQLFELGKPANHVLTFLSK